MGQFSAQLQRQCLFLSIYNIRLYIGFFGDDSFGTTILSPNTWYHAAFTFDSSTLARAIYLNGNFEGQATTTGVLQSPVEPFTVGGAKIGGRVPTVDSYYTGYIDHVRISTRVKSSCEIYLAANLACHFTFNSASPPLDSSANLLSAANSGATLITGVINQALQFSSANTYITVTGISALKSGNNPSFSISMWVRPTTITGGATIIHTSTQSNGQYLSVHSSISILLFIPFDARTRIVSDDVGSDIHWPCQCQCSRFEQQCYHSHCSHGIASQCMDSYCSNIQSNQRDSFVHQRHAGGYD